MAFVERSGGVESIVYFIQGTNISINCELSPETFDSMNNTMQLIPKELGNSCKIL